MCKTWKLWSGRLCKPERLRTEDVGDLHHFSIQSTSQRRLHSACAQTWEDFYCNLAQHLLGALARQALHEGVQHFVAKFAVVNNDALTSVLDDRTVELRGIAQRVFADFLRSDVAGRRQNAFRVPCCVANRADDTIPPARLRIDSPFEIAVNQPISPRLAAAWATQEACPSSYPSQTCVV